MNDPRVDVAKILDHVAKARAELDRAQALISANEYVVEILGGQPLGDFNEAVRRLLWFTTKAQLRARDPHGGGKG